VYAICRIRTELLCPCLAVCSEADLDDMLMLAEYLQLPKATALRVQQHQRAARQMGKSLAAGDCSLSSSLEEDPLLAAAFASAVEEAKSLRRLDDMHTRDDESVFLLHLVAGLCGEDVPPAAAGAGAPAQSAGGVAMWAMLGRIAARQPLSDLAAAPDALRKDARACCAAAVYGHLDVLQVLHAAGWSMHDLRVRTVGRLRNGDPATKITGDAAGCAAEGGHLDMLRWMAANGCPVHASM